MTEKIKVHWKPHKRQEYALIKAQEKVDEVLYGGARGGGKTDAGQVWMIEPKYVGNPKYRGLVIRRNSDDLSDWIDRAGKMYAPLGGVITGLPGVIKFPSGALIRTGHLKDKGAYSKYQGHEYHKLLLEELTQISREGDYEKLLGSCRSTTPELRPQVFATTNPDGDGHDWVKARFDCGNPDEKIREYLDKQTGLTRRRLFIPAKVEDNPTLIENDPGYVAYLNSIQDPVLRKQWREGSWEEPKVEGAYYTKWIREAQTQGRIKDFPIEKELPVHTFWDLGVGDATAIWFMQALGRELRFINYYEVEGEGLTYISRELVRIGNELKIKYGEHFAPHDIRVREFTTGISRFESAAKMGINFQIVPKMSMDDGINAVRTVFDRCWFHKENCKDGLRALKYYRKEFDEKRNEYKNKPYHNWASHGSDAFRYMALSAERFIEEKFIDKKPSEFGETWWDKPKEVKYFNY